LRDKGLLDDYESNDITKLIRLRNLLVHRYWIIDDRKIYETVREDFKNVLSFLEKVANHVK